jgi:hypothetical protein
LLEAFKGLKANKVAEAIQIHE